MNGNPHTHQIKFDESTNGWTAIRVQYGDQPRHYVYTCWPGWRSRVRRAAKRMVRRHDRQSLKAGRRAMTTETLSQEMTLWERSGAWGRDVLAGPPLPRIEATLKREANDCWSISGPGPLPHYFSYKTSALEFAKEHGYVLFREPVTGDAGNNE